LLEDQERNAAGQNEREACQQIGRMLINKPPAQAENSDPENKKGPPPSRTGTSN
jgi:hypothetical protein